jgi:hypothetical protein
MKQLKVNLTPDLRAHLEAAIVRTGRSLAEEVRERLGSSLFADEQLDQPTRSFQAAIPQLARKVRGYFGAEWHADVYACEAMSDAVVELLARHKSTVTASETSTPRDDPAVVGRVIAREYLREREEMEAVITRQRMEKNK